MTVIDNNRDLAQVCRQFEQADFITVDTEFMRERTYWPRLCLIQLADPHTAVAVDPLAEGIDLTPVFDLMANPDILKVFHAARQDIEIFHHLSGKIPAPLFDSQVAAMVCGFGDSVGYDTLASKLARIRIDKSSRFTDWARRPLSDRQIHYALGDVTHLRVIYEKLADRLKKTGRASWLEEEMARLTDPAIYTLHPEDAWKRIKIRSAKPRMLAILKEVTAWREKQAQSRDLPRNRVLRDEALLEIAADPPSKVKELERIRGLSSGFAASAAAQSLMEAITRGIALPDHELPSVIKSKPLPKGAGALIDLLRVLLKARCDSNDVAQKLLANGSDLERIATENNPEIPALSGWRREIFGNDALALKRGELAISARGGQIELIALEHQV